jgi:hypothetical protein
MIAPSEDLIREEAKLISRGVRSLTVIGQCDSTRETVAQTARQISKLAEDGALPFVLDRGDGLADYGFAAASWVIELYHWMQHADIPPVQCKRILELLLGYSPRSIE